MGNQLLPHEIQSIEGQCASGMTEYRTSEPKFVLNQVVHPEAENFRRLLMKVAYFRCQIFAYHTKPYVFPRITPKVAS